MNVNQGSFAIGVDIGGTFTDAIVIDDAGRITIGKAPSTPPSFEHGFIDAIASAAARMGTSADSLVGDARAIFHGCTVGTNALVERRTATVGLLGTKGMTDSLFVMLGGGRNWGLPPEELAHVSMHVKPEPLVPKYLVEEIDERIAFDGNVVVALNEDACRDAVQRLLDEGVEAIAISFMWSVVNPEHEQAAAAIVREMAGGIFVSTASDVIARTGEYQRTVATVVNAAIGPVMDRYLANLGTELAKLGYDDTLYVMSCTGGVLAADYARRLPLLTIDSGPVGGLIGAGALARSGRAGTPTSDDGVDVITADMGGTTFDVGVIRKGRPLGRASSRHGQYEYFVPTIDVRSIGAGGGSIVRFDRESGTLRVGPQSAGAVPGPVAYERGGTVPTVTDADLVLGYLNPDYFLGGAIFLSRDAALNALARVGEPLGFSAEETAAAAVRIVDNQMADAIRLASVKQGYDPRAHVMYAFGGGGPVHATALARELGITRVVVPLSDLASGWSAFGVVSADALVEREMPLRTEYPFDVDAINRGWEELERRVLEIMADQGVASHEVGLSRAVDLRYTAQINDVRIAAPGGVYDAHTTASLIESFEREYARLYGPDSGYAEAGHVMTSLSVRGTAPRSQASAISRADATPPSSSAPVIKSEHDVLFYGNGGGRVPTPVYDGSQFVQGMAVDGPAIIEFADTTIVLWATDHATVDQAGSVAIEVGAKPPSWPT